MTKFGIISDLHMEFDGRGIPFSLNILPDVFYLCAGDVYPHKDVRQKFFDKFQGKIFHVEGNHDFYGSSFTENLQPRALKTAEVDGLKIAGATLWTDLSDIWDWRIYQRYLVDAQHIRDLTYDNYNDAHKMHLEHLLGSGADIIVSHHCPSRFSIHPKFKNEVSNASFTTDLTDIILKMDKPPKLWVHGHTHEEFEYDIGTTRVICHPRGYPGERKEYQHYSAKFVTIN